MEMADFEKVLEQFQKEDVEGMIDMYISTEGLTQDQYKSMLKFFPIGEIPRLEAALR